MRERSLVLGSSKALEKKAGRTEVPALGPQHKVSVASAYALETLVACKPLLPSVTS
jgi:hypothetical protein